jgi:hypothetical protein
MVKLVGIEDCPVPAVKYFRGLIEVCPTLGVFAEVELDRISAGGVPPTNSSMTAYARPATGVNAAIRADIDGAGGSAASSSQDAGVGDRAVLAPQKRLPQRRDLPPVQIHQRPCR